jgi:hypothetical protein
MKRTLLLYALPFAVYCLTALLIPNIQYGYFQGAMFNAGYGLGIVHLLSGLAFVLACIVPVLVYGYNLLKAWR